MDLGILFFLIFVRCVALRNSERNLSALLLRTLVVGRRQPTTMRVDRGCSRYGVKRFDEPFLILVGAIVCRVVYFLSRFGLLLV